jgi:hypothetical protein
MAKRSFSINFHDNLSVMGGKKENFQLVDAFLFAESLSNKHKKLMFD